ncbi:MAG: 2-hydroxyacid dehydrogenase [Oligosphaeraceae bacterium]
MKIAFFDTKPYERRAFQTLAGAYPGLTLDFREERLTPATARLAEGCPVVCAFVNDDLQARTLEILARGGTRLLAMRCAGFNNVDLRAACGKMQVVRVPGYSPQAVAEFTLALLLCVNRRLHRAYTRVREGNFSLDGLQGMVLHGKTVGLVGTGRIGQAFARLMTGFGVRLLFSDPFPQPGLARETGGEYTTLEELLRQSDVISLHCPLTPENTHLVNRETLKQMKPGVLLVNTSRGKLIHTQALIQALKTGRVGGAGLDVYEEEAGYFFEDRSSRIIRDDVLARLLTFPNVVLTSHQAFLTHEALASIARTTLENIREFQEGRPLSHSVCQECNLHLC